METVLHHEDYTIALIAVLYIEAEAVLGMLDKRHKGQFETIRGDDFIYIGGEVNRHNVVIATWPDGQSYGVGAASALANQVKTRFEHLQFALLIGIAAGLPYLPLADPTRLRDIRLGDVLVCVPDKVSTGIIQYDLGKDTEAEFLLNGRQAETPAIVRSAIRNIRLTKKRPYGKGNEFMQHLKMLQQNDKEDRFQCPSQHKDQLYNNSPIKGAPPILVPREAREEDERTQVWYGNFGSGNSLMRNPKRRDELRDKYNLIGLEMEAAGIMNTLPTGVIRGVCDYGDGQKNDDWQAYAAAVAAVYAKGILYAITPKVGNSTKTPSGEAFVVTAATKRTNASGSIRAIGQPRLPMMNFLDDNHLLERFEPNLYWNSLTVSALEKYKQVYLHLESDDLGNVCIDSLKYYFGNNLLLGEMLQRIWNRVEPSFYGYLNKGQVLAVLYMLHLEYRNGSPDERQVASSFKGDRKAINLRFDGSVFGKGQREQHYNARPTENYKTKVTTVNIQTLVRGNPTAGLITRIS